MVFPRRTPFEASRVNQTTGLRNIFLRAGSPHPPELESETRADGYRWPEEVEEERQTRQEKLNQFAQLIRAKSQWYSKILKQKDLTNKWILESAIEDGPDLRELIRELHQEAQRILTLDHTIILQSTSLPYWSLNDETISRTVEKAISYLRCCEYAIDEPELYEAVGAYIADDVVPAALHAEIARELDALAALGPKDYHPGSGGKVQDLIHPSLYPYMAGVTPLGESVQPPFALDGTFVTSMRSKHPSAEDSVVFKSAYAWVPSVIKVSENGARTTIDGYINGLGSREQFPTLFQLIEQVFALVLPLLEKAFTFKFEHKPENQSYQRWLERRDYLECAETPFDQEAWGRLLERQAIMKDTEQDVIRSAKSLRAAKKVEERAFFDQHQSISISSSRWAGQNLKVVIKAARYILEPGQEYAGTWHIEGMPHERIVASAIYYYDRDSSIQDAGLYLRRRRDGDLDFPSGEEHMSHEFNASFEDKNKTDGYLEIVNNPSDYGSDYGLGNMTTYINVGVIPTMKEKQTSGTGRIVAFPNWLQHRVVSLRNDAEAPDPAVRKILCFFLVDNGALDDEFDPTEFPGFEYDELDDEMHVLTTLDIPSQARACNLPTAAFLLRVAFRQRAGRHIPNELINLVLGELQNTGAQLSRQAAEERRRSLMADRKVNARASNQFWEEEWSLCEH